LGKTSVHWTPFKPDISSSPRVSGLEGFHCIEVLVLHALTYRMMPVFIERVTDNGKLCCIFHSIVYKFD